jgi:hypothetical protein
VPDPAPGVIWGYNFPAGYQILLLGVQYRLVASALVAVRRLGFQIERPGLFFYAIHTQIALGVTANQNYICSWLPGCAFIQTVTVGVAPLNGTHQMTLPYPVIMNPGDRLAAAVGGLQVGDQLSDIYLYYLEMPLTQ